MLRLSQADCFTGYYPPRPCFELKEDIRILLWGILSTRWLHGRRRAVSRFVLLADDSAEVPNLVKKSYSQFRLTSSDWDQLTKMHDVLQEPGNITQSFFSAKFPTVWRALPEALAETWANMAATKRFEGMRDSINAGLENLEKWYSKTDDTDFDDYYTAPAAEIMEVVSVQTGQ
ncbi:hypothetical protein DFH09DRAFT_1076781 [Mycena vulgaris]|nr:hypothetical protein DFH09DRAFT_1076781 [Mycena vulgaris]